MRKRSRKAKGVIFFAFLVFAVVLGALVVRKYRTATRQAPPVQQVAPQPEKPAGTQVVTLFFGSADGDGLVREGREEDVADGVEDGVASVVDDLVSGPLGGYAPTLPENARVLGVRVNGDVAEIDFSRELRDGLPDGSSAEMLAVYSVVDTVAANFPQIHRVQFLIDGEKAQSLKGHLDLRNAIPPDFTLERPAAAGSEPGPGSPNSPTVPKSPSPTTPTKKGTPL